MNPTIPIQYFSTPYGELLLGAYNEQLCLCDWRYRKMRETVDKRLQEGLGATYQESESRVVEQAKEQLTAYFEGKLQTFSVPLYLVGSAFQKQVWQVLQEVPYGKTQTYLGLSRALGNEKAIRAVASANGANALSIFIPCHRIIGSDGSLTGYAGGLQAKQKLLQLENALQPGQLGLFG